MPRLLLDAGAGVNERNERGWTPLHLAAQNGYPVEALALLLEHGAILDAKDSEGRTPLYYAIDSLSSDDLQPDLKRVAFLLDQGADPDAQDTHEFTPRDRADISCDNWGGELEAGLVNLGLCSQGN